MVLTEQQIGRLERDWSKVAGSLIDVEQVRGTIYGFGSELGTLRLLKKYVVSGMKYGDKFRHGRSAGTDAFYFALDL